MIVVTGATGNVGRHVVAGVAAAGRPVRAVTRDAASAPAAQGAHIVEANPARPETADAALDGASALFVNYSAVREGAADLLERARKHGVGRVVLLSSAAIERDDPAANPIAALHQSLEDAVAASGIDFTFLRPDMFAVNTIKFWGRQIRAGDVVRAAYGDAALAPIDERDVAAVAVAALTEPSARHVGRRYLLTGPQALTQRRMVELIGAAVGRPLRFEEIPREQAVAGMAEEGVPEPVADGLLTLHERFTRAPMPLAPSSEHITGVPPHTFGQWARLHAPDFTAA